VNSPAAKKPEPPKKPDFERSLARLEEVVRRLESPQLSLDDAMKLFEEGVALSRECQKQLEEAEGRVEILLKKADGKLAAEPFDPSGRRNRDAPRQPAARPFPAAMKLPPFFEEGRLAVDAASRAPAASCDRATCFHSYGDALQRLRRR